MNSFQLATWVFIYIVIIKLIQVFLKINTINAAALRQEPSTLLDRADYRRETFVIQRAGKPKAVLMPYTEFEQLQRVRQEAQERYYASVAEMRNAFAYLSNQEIDALVEKAIQFSIPPYLPSCSISRPSLRFCPTKLISDI